MLRTFRYSTVLIFAVLLLAATVGAQDGLALMKIEHGARSAGMAAAVVSLTDDPNGVVYNPATIVSLDGFTASFGHTVYWENVRLESGFFATNLSKRMFLHGGIRYAVIDEIEQRLLPTLEPDNYFDAHDVSFKSGMSYRVSDKVAVGLSLGWFIEKIEGWRGSAFNADFGLLVMPTANLNVGASVTNLGNDFQLEKSGQPGSRDISLPTTYSLGASYRYEKYTGAADLVIVDDEAHLHLGAEGRLHELFSLRAGYMFNYDSKNLTAGASFTKRNYSVDYAFVPYDNDLGTSHIFNFTFSL